MTPAAQAASVYQKEPCSHDFEHDLFWHLENGYVFSTPQFFVMGRPVRRFAPEAMVFDLGCVHGNPDAWLVWLAAGDLRRVVEVLPYWLPWIGFQRRNKLRWHETDKILSKITQDGC